MGSAGTVSTDGNDTFTATNLTLLSGDVINGGAGADILNVAMTANPVSAATVVGVETVNVNAASFTNLTFDAASVVGVGTTINANNTQVGGATGLTINNVGSGATVVGGTGVMG